MEVFRHDFARDIRSVSSKQKTLTFRLKNTLYAFYGKLLANFVSSQVVYIILLLIETFIFCYYLLIIWLPKCNILDNLIAPKTFIYVYSACCGIVLLYFILFIMLAALAFCSVGDASKNSSKQAQSPSEWREYFKCWFRLYGFLLSVYLHVLFFPITWALIVPISPATTLEEATGIGLIIVSIIGLLISTAITILTIFFFHDEELDSDLPWTMSSHLVEYMKFLKKIFIAVAFTYIERETLFESEILIGVCLASIIEIIAILKGQQLAKKIPNYAYVLCETLVITFSLSTLINLVANETVFDVFLIFFMVWPTTAAIILIIKQNQTTVLMASNNYEENSEDYVRNMLLLVEADVDTTTHNTTNCLTAQVVGFLRHHAMYCNKPECPCKDIIIGEAEENSDREQQQLQANTTMTDNTGNFQSNMLQETDKNSSIPKYKRTLFTFLNYLIKSGMLSNADKDAKPFILSSEIQLRFLENKFQALYDLQEAQECNPTLYEEYSISRLKHEIEIKILEENTKGDTLGSGAIDRCIQFQEKFIRLQDLISVTTESYIKLWKELLKDTPDYRDITNLGYKIAVNLDKVNSLYEEILKIVQTNVKASIIYTLFLYNVVKDTFAAHERYLATKLVMDSYHINKKLWETAEGNYGEDSTSAVVLISGNKFNLGTILNTNHELYEILGYEKSLAMGQNVSLLMPEIIASYHNKFVQNCFTSTYGGLLTTKERLIFPQHCSGYIVPCNIFTRLIPNLEKGIQFIGFLNRAKLIDELRKGESRISVDDPILFLLDSELKLHGFNRRFMELLGNDLSLMNMHKYLDADRKIDLSILYPSIFNAENITAMCSEDGVTLDMDITKMVELLQEEIVNEIENEQQDSYIKHFRGNIKLKEYLHAKEGLKYYLCSIMSDAIKAFQNGAASDIQLNADAENQRNKDAQLLAIQDDASVSQTTSSNTTTSDYDVRTIKEFRVHIKEKQDPYTIMCFRYFSYVLYVALLTVYGIVFWVKSDLTSTFTTGFQLAGFGFQRWDHIIVTAYNVRTLRNIYLGKMDDSSSVLHDRHEYYYHIAGEIASDLLYFHEQHIDLQHKDNSFDNAFQQYESQDSISLMGIDKWDGHNIIAYGPEFKCNLAVAVREIATKINFLTGDRYEEFSAMDDIKFEKWDREAAFVINNIIHKLIGILEDTCHAVLDLAVEKGQSQSQIFIGIAVGVCLSVVATLLVLLPFIYRAHCGVVVVFNLFLKLPREDLVKLIESAQAYQKQVNKHFTAIVKHFNEIDFRDEVNAEKDAIIQAGRNAKAKAKAGVGQNVEKPETSKEPEDEEDVLNDRVPLQGNLNSQIEELEHKRKIASVTAASTGSRNKLMFEIVGMTIIFGAYFLTFTLLRLQYFDKMDKAMDTLDVLSTTKPLISSVMLFMLEDFTSQETTLLNQDGVIQEAYDRHNTELENNEAEREIFEHEIEENFEDLANFIEEMNTQQFCDVIDYDKELANDCYTACHGLLSKGLENGINQGLLETETLYHKYLNARKLQNTEYLNGLLRQERVEDLFDMNSVYLASGAEHFQEKIDDEGHRLFSEVNRFDLIDLLVFCILMTFMFLVALSWFLKNFKHSMWRTKRMLGIMPTKYIASQLEEVKSLIKQIS